MKKHSSLQWASIGLLFALLAVWIVAITRKDEHPWANNPWYPTVAVALLWGVWIEKTKKY